MSDKTRLVHTGDCVISAVRRFAEENHLLQKGDKVLVALSGGADSVALLHVLISLKEEYSLTLYAAHFNHGIRGKEADRDEAFAADLCEEYKVPLYRRKADVPAIAAESGESEELCGRRQRYSFFEETARALGGAKIATAHHRDDNVETVLWNLTRGSGIGGLCGIPVKRGNIIRPLLCVSREQIEAYCRGNGLPFVTDSTNLSDDYTRNRLRRQVMPVLRELNGSVGENIGRTASIMREADDYFNKISTVELKKAKNAFGYSCEALTALEPIVLKYAVKNLLENAGAPVDFRHITLIIKEMHTGGAVDLGQRFTAVCAQGTLRIVDGGGQADVPCGSLADFLNENGVRLTVRDGKLYDETGALFPVGEKSEKINNLLLNNCIPCDIISSDTALRHRRAGDTFTDARRGVTKTLKKLMNELKIPRERRDSYPVIANGSVVLWMRGCGVSAQARVDLSRDGDIIFIKGEQSCIRI